MKNNKYLFLKGLGVYLPMDRERFKDEVIKKTAINTGVSEEVVQQLWNQQWKSLNIRIRENAKNNNILNTIEVSDLFLFKMKPSPNTRRVNKICSRVERTTKQEMKEKILLSLYDEIIFLVENLKEYIKTKEEKYEKIKIAVKNEKQELEKRSIINIKNYINEAKRNLRRMEKLLDSTREIERRNNKSV